HDVVDAAVPKLSGVVDRDDVRVLELRDEARLGEEARREIAAAGIDEDLQRDLAPEIGVLDAVDRAHAAAAQAREEPGSRSGQVRQVRDVAEVPDHAVAQGCHGRSVPRRKRASRRNSSSDPVTSRRRSRTRRRNSRRAHDRWFVTVVTGTPNRAARSWYEGRG